MSRRAFSITSWVVFIVCNAAMIVSFMYVSFK